MGGKGYYETKGLTNARRWHGISPEVKAVYIFGYHDALLAGALDSDRCTQEEKIERLAKIYPTTMNEAQISLAIDAFYDDVLNFLIPVSSAISLLAIKAAGMPEADFDQMLWLARDDAGKVLDDRDAY